MAAFSILARAHGVRRFSTAANKVLQIESMNQHLRAAEYAVRGELVMTAGEYERQIQAGEGGHLPFDKLVYCNIGNPHSVGQQPLSFGRSVLSLCMNPQLLQQPQEKLLQLFPEDAISRARLVLEESKGGLGAYSHSKGVGLFRESVATFLEERDGCPADPEDIFLSNGASAGIELLMKMLIRGPEDGIMIPVPQYPLYSATVTSLNGTQVPYHLQESTNWSLNWEVLTSALTGARSKGVNVRALCLINPGNPTSACLDKPTLQELVKFCERERLVLMADEVYQTNVYGSVPFVSCKKVVREMGSSVELVSFHSTSKGMLGECGLRGGYMEMVNMDAEVKDQVYKVASISLCPNLAGQLMVDLMVNPPKPGSPSYELYTQEYDAQFSSLKSRSEVLSKTLDALPGMSCSPIQGAMYAFPQVMLPPKAVQAARQQGKEPDTMYCLEMLRQTGVCVVPGSGFGQEEGTFHFRTTFLPPEEVMMEAVEKVKEFHLSFMAKYA